MNTLGPKHTGTIQHLVQLHNGAKPIPGWITWFLQTLLTNLLVDADDSEYPPDIAFVVRSIPVIPIPVPLYLLLKRDTRGKMALNKKAIHFSQEAWIQTVKFDDNNDQGGWS